MTTQFDPQRDLVLQRVVDVPVDRVWAAWTEPERLKQWFTPKPWMTVDCEIDLRPGGLFRTVMRSPDGQDYPNVGCYLEVVPGRRIVWTSALSGGFRPVPHAHEDLVFTAIVAMESDGAGTRYSATAMHKDPDNQQKHEAMGFHNGWSAALDQLVALCGRG